jgi:glycosyltransferase involved in cell wall biosynthesis
LVGDGEDGDMLQEESRKLGVQDRVHFMGSRTDVCKMLSACDAFVFPSIHEGFGLATIEAAASGLPLFISEAAAQNISHLNLNGQIVLPITKTDWTKALEDIPVCDRKKQSLNNEQLIRCAGYDIKKEATIIERAFAR